LRHEKEPRKVRKANEKGVKSNGERGEKHLYSRLFHLIEELEESEGEELEVWSCTRSN
jgi:hypothetical protein